MRLLTVRQFKVILSPENLYGPPPRTPRLPSLTSHGQGLTDTTSQFGASAGRAAFGGATGRAGVCEAAGRVEAAGGIWVGTGPRVKTTRSDSFPVNAPFRRSPLFSMEPRHVSPNVSFHLSSSMRIAKERLCPVTRISFRVRTMFKLGNTSVPLSVPSAAALI